MYIYDRAHQLAADIKQSEEFKTYKALKATTNKSIIIT